MATIQAQDGSMLRLQFAASQWDVAAAARAVLEEARELLSDELSLIRRKMHEVLVNNPADIGADCVEFRFLPLYRVTGERLAMVEQAKWIMQQFPSMHYRMAELMRDMLDGATRQALDGVVDSDAPTQVRAIAQAEACNWARKWLEGLGRAMQRNDLADVRRVRDTLKSVGILPEANS